MSAWSLMRTRFGRWAGLSSGSPHERDGLAGIGANGSGPPLPRLGLRFKGVRLMSSLPAVQDTGRHYGINPAGKPARSSSTGINKMKRASTCIEGGLPSGMPQPPAVSRPDPEHLDALICTRVGTVSETRVHGLTS